MAQRRHAPVCQQARQLQSPVTCVSIQPCCCHDAACDGATCVDLCLHLVPALQGPMLGHHQALVVLQGGAVTIGLAGEALVLVVALQDNGQCKCGDQGDN